MLEKPLGGDRPTHRRHIVNGLGLSIERQSLHTTTTIQNC
jgi:hypothetical protein